MSQRVVLGKTGLEVSPICFGTWQLSPRFWGEQDKGEIIAAMRAGLEAGVNFIDTAEAYGDGYGETVVGEFLAEAPRDQVVVTTKVFNHFRPDSSRYPDVSAGHVRQRCELELKRLRTDRIDLYLLHMFDPLTPPAEIAGCLEELKKEGKIRCYGVSNYTVEQFRAYRRFGAYDAVQPPYSLIATDIEADLLGYCQAENVGVMVYSPLGKGLLTGKYKGTETFDDFRQSHRDFQGDRFKAIAGAVQSLAPMAEKYGLSVVQLVLAATLMHPGIQVAVVGIKTREQIVEAAGAMGKSISRDDYFRIRWMLTVGDTGKIKDAQGTRK